MLKPDFKVLLVTDRTLAQERGLLWVIEEALNGGIKAVQLREKDLLARELFFMAEEVSKLCQSYSAALFINDRIDVALAVDAAGVQLGSTSVDIATARRLIGTKKLIGFSSHTLNESRQAEELGADFVLFGPIYFTPSKASYGAPQGLKLLRHIVENVSVPVYAIGGIKAENVAAVKHIGVFGVALISGIVSVAEPKAAAQELIEIMGSG